ncbi:MAG: hypothetical protein WD512_15330 [Candidatus Paceibacterota bacterium]
MSKSERSDIQIRQISKEFSFNVVTYTIQLEEMLTMIICLELSKDWMKMGPYMDYFDNVGFESKINLAEIILKANHSHILKKFPKIIEEIRTMKILRNNVAHRNRHYEMDSEGKNTKFVLFHRKINKQIRFTESQMLQRTKKLEKCVNDMQKVLGFFGRDFNIKAIV